MEKKINEKHYQVELGFNNALHLESFPGRYKIMTEQEIINEFITMAKYENVKVKAMKNKKIAIIDLLDTRYSDTFCNLIESGFDIEEYHKSEDSNIIKSIKINGTLYEIEKD